MKVKLLRKLRRKANQKFKLIVGVNSRLKVNFRIVTEVRKFFFFKEKIALLNCYDDYRFATKKLYAYKSIFIGVEVIKLRIKQVYASNKRRSIKEFIKGKKH